MGEKSLLGLSGLVHAVLGYYFYYVVQLISASIYLIGYCFGFYSGYDMKGEESIIFVIIIGAGLFIGAYVAIMIIMNHLLIKNAQIYRRKALFINGIIFLVVFIPRAIDLRFNK